VGKNNKKGQQPEGAVQANIPAKPQFFEKIVGQLVQAPVEWPEAKRRLFTAVERSLLEKPEFARLSVLPSGCLFTLFMLVPVNDALGVAAT
jgi:hypothetical protein